jgi:hypothetical protein
MMAVVADSTVGWFIELRVTELMLADVLARAGDQVEAAVVPRLSPADFEPPYTQTKLDSLNVRLNSILDRTRQSGSAVIRVELSGA